MYFFSWTHAPRNWTGKRLYEAQVKQIVFVLRDTPGFKLFTMLNWYVNLRLDRVEVMDL